MYSADQLNTPSARHAGLPLQLLLYGVLYLKCKLQVVNRKLIGNNVLSLELLFAQVFGSKGMIQVGNVREDSVNSFYKDGGTSTALQYSFPQRYKDAYLKEMDTFLTIVSDPTCPCPVTKQDVLLSSRVADACERSLKEGKMVTLEPLN